MKSKNWRRPTGWGWQCFLLITLTGLSWFSAGSTADGLEVSVHTSKERYCTGDTVLLLIAVAIPEGYVFIGNPKGPGIGRPMKLCAVTDAEQVRWLEIRKPVAKKYGLAFGEWVWTYTGITRFFGLGIITGKNVRSHPDIIHGRVELEGLLCSNQCRLESVAAPFTIRTNGFPHSAAGKTACPPQWIEEFQATSPFPAGNLQTKPER